MRKRSTLVCAACLITAAVAPMAGSARADDSTVVNVLRCSDPGSATVPAGQPITLRLGGYAVGTLGLMRNALLSQTTTLTVGTTRYDLSDQWSAPFFVSAFNFWEVTQPDRLLGTLTAGQTVVVTYDITFSHPVAILFPPVRSSGDNGPFVITEDGPATCAITAT
jgi:hypothetical protein